MKIEKYDTEILKKTKPKPEDVIIPLHRKVFPKNNQAPTTPWVVEINVEKWTIRALDKSTYVRCLRILDENGILIFSE